MKKFYFSLCAIFALCAGSVHAQSWSYEYLKFPTCK